MRPIQPVRRVLVLAVTIDMAVNSFLVPVIPRLLADGWQVHVVCAPGELQLGELSGLIEVHFIPMARRLTPMADVVALARWATLLRQLDPDLVVGSTPKAAMLSMVAARAVGVPVRVFQVRGAKWDGGRGWRNDVVRIADRVTAGCATGVLAVSDSLADLLVEHGVCRTRPVVLGGGSSKGVDPDRFRPRTQPRQPGEPPVMGFIGRLSADKGLPDLLAAHRAVLEHDDRARLVVVGGIDPSAPVDQATRAQLAGPGIASLGFRTDICDILPGFDILALPSLREGFPNVVLEAAACAVPTVGFDVTGVRDAVVPGVTGLLVPRGDREAFARACASLVADRDRCRQLGAAARRRVEARYATSSVVALFADHLADLAARRSGRAASGGIQP